MPLTELFVFAWVVGLGASGAYGAYAGGAYGGGAYVGMSTGAAAYAGLFACAAYPGLAVCALGATAGAAVGTSGALREDAGGSGRAVLGALCVRWVNICFHRRGVGGCDAIPLKVRKDPAGRVLKTERFRHFKFPERREVQRRKVSELLLLPVVVEGDLLDVAVVRLRRGAVAGVHRGLGLVRVKVGVRLRVSEP